MDSYHNFMAPLARIGEFWYAHSGMARVLVIEDQAELAETVALAADADPASAQR